MNEDVKTYQGETRLSIGKAAKYLGVSIDTLRRWEKKGKILPLRSPGGHRYYELGDLDGLFGRKYERAQDAVPVKKPPAQHSDSETPAQTVNNSYQQPETRIGVSIEEIKPQEPPPPVIPPTPPQTPKPSQEPPAPAKETVIAQEQPQTFKTGLSKTLTGDNKAKLEDILKDYKKPRNSLFEKILIAGVIIFLIVDIVIVIAWLKASGGFVSPLP